jgi:restriction system protein
MTKYQLFYNTLKNVMICDNMSIPDYQTLMLPVLQYHGDKIEHTNQETINAIAIKFNLTEKERNEILPSGSQLVFDNRLTWAITYLFNSGLLKRISRGRYVITDRGLAVLNEKPGKIGTKYLEKFPEFLEFKKHRRGIKTENEVNKALIPTDGLETGYQELLTPTDRLESGYQELRAQLSHDLLERVMKSTPTFFEKLVIQLLVKLGYGGSNIEAGQAIGRSGDDGIDGIIKEDKLGLDVIHVQAKRWENKTVGRPDIQAFAGSLEGQRSKKGVFITTSKFTSDAKEYVRRIEKKIILIDGEHLVQLMIDNSVGVSEETKYIIYKIDEDFFIDE